MQNHPNYRQLVSIRNFLEDYVPNFPENKCQMTTRFLNKVMGYKEVAGTYNGIKYGDETFHAWSLDEATNQFIDLTIRQFDKSQKPITILPVNTTLLLPKKIYTKIQLETKDDLLWGNLFEELTVLDIVHIYKENYQKV